MSVYFMYVANQPKEIKIGHSGNPPDRAKAGQTFHARKLLISTTIKVKDIKKAKELESLLHNIFNQLRYDMDGGEEWFNMRLSDAARIKLYWEESGCRISKQFTDKCYLLAEEIWTVLGCSDIEREIAALESRIRNLKIE